MQGGGICTACAGVYHCSSACVMLELGFKEQIVAPPPLVKQQSPAALREVGTAMCLQCPAIPLVFLLTLPIRGRKASMPHTSALIPHGSELSETTSSQKLLMSWGSTEVGATPLPKGTPYSATLLPPLPELQANATCPREEKRSTPCSAHWMAAEGGPRPSKLVDLFLSSPPRWSRGAVELLLLH